MGRKSIGKMNGGYTFFEVLISSALMLIVLSAFSTAYIVFYKGQLRSKISVQKSYTLLTADYHIRQKTGQIQNSYWENPLPKIRIFIDSILMEQPVTGVSFTKANYMFDKQNRLRGLEFYYTLNGEADEHRVKCFFSFVPLIPLQQKKGTF